jgi:hypothetical protein
VRNEAAKHDGPAAATFRSRDGEVPRVSAARSARGTRRAEFAAPPVATSAASEIVTSHADHAWRRAIPYRAE